MLGELLSQSNTPLESRVSLWSGGWGGKWLSGNVLECLVREDLPEVESTDPGGFRWEGSEDGGNEEGGGGGRWYTGQEGEGEKATQRLGESRGQGSGWLCWRRVKSVTFLEDLLCARAQRYSLGVSCSMLTTTLTSECLIPVSRRVC